MHIWTLTKHIEKKLDRNCTRMLQAILNKTWKQHPTKQQLYSHLPPISKTNQVRWTRHVRYLMLNSLYTCILNMICKYILTFLNEPKLFLLHTVKWFQVLLYIANNSIKHQSFVYTQLNDETVLFLTIQFSTSHLFAISLNVKQFCLIHR